MQDDKQLARAKELMIQRLEAKRAQQQAQQEPQQVQPQQQMQQQMPQPMQQQGQMPQGDPTQMLANQQQEQSSPLFDRMGTDFSFINEVALADPQDIPPQDIAYNVRKMESGELLQYAQNFINPGRDHVFMDGAAKMTKEDLS